MRTFYCLLLLDIFTQTTQGNTRGRFCCVQMEEHKGIGKMLQNGQTEPIGVTRRRMRIRREVKFVYVWSILTFPLQNEKRLMLYEKCP